MAKPLKFHHTLNQAPRSPKHGQHRRSSPTTHRHSVDRAGDGAGGSDQGRAAWTVNVSGFTSFAWDLAASEPAPPAIPYAGIRTGEIIAHRLWWVIEGQLCSLAHRMLWKPNETIHGNTLKVVDDLSMLLGSRLIWGGTYGFQSTEQISTEVDYILTLLERAKDTPLQDRPSFMAWGFQPLFETRTFVAGTVKMWGDVVEHERGYRAEYAKLNSIDEMHGPGDIDAIRARYGVGPLTQRETTP